MLATEKDEAISSGARRYFTGRPCRRGHVAERFAGNGACVECFKSNTMRAYRAKNAQRLAAYNSAWKKDNKEKVNAASNRWKKENAERVRAWNAARWAAKLKRTPAWADLAAIRAFYEACPEGHHVDHIIPLRGKGVSGLHVLENLQYLPASVNISKGNRWVDPHLIMG